MTYSPIARDSLDWDVPLNAALVDQDGRITTNTSAVATLQGQMITVTATANGALQKTSNLSDLTSASSARTNLGLGGSATLNVGTTTGTVAAGDDTRITGALQAASNLSDLASASTARTNLGLGGAAVLNVGTTAGTVAAGNDSRITGALQTTGGTMSGAIAMGTSKITGLGNGSAAQDAAAFGQIPTAGTGSTNYTVGNDTRLLQIYNMGPQMQGFLAWNYDCEECTATGAGANVSGTIYLHKIYFAQGQTISNLAVGVQTAGSTLTAGQNLIGIYNSSGTRVAQSADQSGSWTSTGFKSIAMTASYTVNTAGYHYIAILAVGTTPPAFYQNANAPSALFNGNTAAGTFRHCTGGTGQTSLPASITLGSTTSSAFNSWAAAL